MSHLDDDNDSDQLPSRLLTVEHLFILLNSGALFLLACFADMPTLPANAGMAPNQLGTLFIFPAWLFFDAEPGDVEESLVGRWLVLLG